MEKLPLYGSENQETMPVRRAVLGWPGWLPADRSATSRQHSQSAQPGRPVTWSYLTGRPPPIATGQQQAVSRSVWGDRDRASLRSGETGRRPGVSQARSVQVGTFAELYHPPRFEKILEINVHRTISIEDFLNYFVFMSLPQWYLNCFRLALALGIFCYRTKTRKN